MNISGSDLRLLEVFDCVVRNQGFSAAQLELGLSQPTISNHISTLEKRLGIKLCQRGRRGFLLTEKGEIAHQLAQNLLRTINQHSNQLSALKGQLTGQLRIAAVDCIATDNEMKLPQTIGEFKRCAPSVKLCLSTARPQEILRLVSEGEIDIGIGSFDNPVGSLVYLDLYQERHAYYCGASHPLFSSVNTNRENSTIEEYAWVHRGYWNQQRQRALQMRESDVQVDDIESQLIMILSGEYIGLLPEHLALSFEKNRQLKRLQASEEYPYVCQMQMTHRSGNQRRIIQLFSRLLRDSYAQP